MEVFSWLRRSRQTAVPLAPATQVKGKTEEEDLFGVNDELVNLIKSFTLDTFKNFPLQDEQRDNCEDEYDGVEGKSGNVPKDLSDWREKHATLVLSKVKELSLLRFRLCPRYLKERQFWRIYFTLVKSCVAEYELRAIRLEKFKQMAIENKNVLHTTASEVEMLAAKKPTNMEAETSLEYILNPSV